MSRPGLRLRSLARRLCSDAAMARIVDPAIADLQFEYAAAVRTGARWRIWLACARGLFACSAAIARGWLSFDAAVVPRLLLWTTLATAAISALFVWIPLDAVRARIAVDVDWRLLAVLVPQAVVAAVALGFASALAIVLRNGDPTRRLRRDATAIAACSCAGILLLVAIVVPRSNQAFRELVAGPFVQRGNNEMTPIELWRAGQWLDLNLRAALLCAPWLLTAFVWQVATRWRGWLGTTLALAGVSLYATPYVVWPPYWEMWAPLMPAIAAAWVPNLLVATATLAASIRERTQAWP